MLKELFDAIVAKGVQAEEIKVHQEPDGRRFKKTPRGELEVIDPPRFPYLVLRTLSGLVDFVKANRDNVPLNDCVVVVQDHRSVQVADKVRTTYLQRDSFVAAVFEGPEQFRFGQWMEQEEFIIQAQAKLVESNDRARLLKVVGSVTTGAVRTASDDGITQQVTTKVGATLKGAESVNNPFVIAPYRTFHDVPQPESAFILRAQERADKTPLFSLFEADGGYWKKVAAEYIRSYLKRELPEGMVVIA